MEVQKKWRVLSETKVNLAKWLWKHSCWLFKAVVFEIITTAATGGGSAVVVAVFRKEADKLSQGRGETRLEHMQEE